MNVFGKKTELEVSIEGYKQAFSAEHDMAEMSAEVWRQWSKLESDYSRELLMIKVQLDKMPRKFE